MWTVIDAKKEEETFDEIDRENDRAAAILAAAILEDDRPPIGGPHRMLV
jgi:hypothetical protein